MIRCRRSCLSGRFVKCHYCGSIACHSVLQFEPQLDSKAERVVRLLHACCTQRHLTSAPREARSDLRAGDLGGGQRPQAPTVRLMRQARQEQDPAPALLQMDPSRSHDMSPATELRILHNLHLDAWADADRVPRSPAKRATYRATETPLMDPMTGTQSPGRQSPTVAGPLVQDAQRPAIPTNSIRREDRGGGSSTEGAFQW